MGSDSFDGLGCSVEDEVEGMVTKGKELFCNLEKRRILEHIGVDLARGVARGLELWAEDSEEMKMKGVDGGEGFVSGDVVAARVSDNKDASEGTLLLGKSCNEDGTKKVVRVSCAHGSGETKGGYGGNEGFDLRRSLKVEVIDDAAVVEQVPACVFRGMVKEEIGIPTCPKNQKEVTDGEEVAAGKKARGAWRKPKNLPSSEKMLGEQENGKAHFQKSKAGCKLMYSIKEMEALRFVNVIEQRRFWRRVYDSLGPVAKEYVSLLCCCNNDYQHAQHGLNFDCMQLPLGRQQAPGVLNAMTGRGRGNPHSDIFVPPCTMKTLYTGNWSYVS